MIDQSVKGFITRLFSASQVAIQYALLILSIAKQNIYLLYLTIWTILKSFILFYPKQLMKKSSLGKRPKLAYDCDMFGSGGKPWTGGLISGHMTIILMLSTVLVLNMNEIGKMNESIIPGLLIVITTTGLARYYSNCHSSIQIAFGSIAGLLLGLVVYMVEKPLENLERFKKDKENIYSYFN